MPYYENDDEYENVENRWHLNNLIIKTNYIKYIYIF